MIRIATLLFLIASMPAAGGCVSVAAAETFDASHEISLLTNEALGSDTQPFHFRVGIRAFASALCDESALNMKLVERTASPSGDECYWRIDLMQTSAETCSGGELSDVGCYVIPTLYFFANSVDGRISSLRYRLNAERAPTQNGLRLLQSRASLLLAAHGLRLPVAVEAAIGAGEDGRWDEAGVGYTFRRLDGDPPRFDLTVGFVLDPAEKLDPEIEHRCNGAMCSYVLR